MTTFVLLLLLAGALGLAAKFAKSQLRPAVITLLRGGAVALAVLAVAITSFVHVPGGSIATLERTMFARALPAGHIVAFDGELGPQARIITAGWHLSPLINILNRVEVHPIFVVPPGKCAVLTASDGAMPPNGAAFADPFLPGAAKKMVDDAEYFLKNGGQRGVQTSVLTPGSYTLNPFLWKWELSDAIRVEQGTVGVVKSSVYGAVEFGPFQRFKPTNSEPKLLAGRLPKGSAAVNIVATGAVGVWEESLLPNLYYINPRAYKITHVPVTVMVFEYKGGYSKRTIEITVDDKSGSITQKESIKEVQPVPEAADTAVFVKPEGWDVAQEARVLVQINPLDAPIVTAALGFTDQNARQTIDDRVITPIFRSVTRDVIGGKSIRVSSNKALVGTNDLPILDEKGEPKTIAVNEFRPVKVLDLLNNRDSIESAIEEQMRPEAAKEFVTVLEVRLADSAIPPELLVARKREQLAQQMVKAWQQEEAAQKQRQQTENARSQAEQQGELVKAEMAKKAADLIAQSTTIKAEGEKKALIALAEGQKAQKDILGDAATVELRKFEMSLKALQDIITQNPNVVQTALANAGKFVPEVVVGGSSGGFEGFAAVFGHLLNKNAEHKSK